MSGNHRQQHESAPETSDQLVSLAEQYFAREFPDSGRGCPSPAEIGKQIELGQLPDDALRTHLLSCSTCFVAYRERLQKFRDAQPVPFRRRISEFLRNPWMRVLVPSLPVLLLVVAGVVYLWSKNPQQQHVTSATPPVEVVNANANAVPTASPSAVQVDSPTQPDKGTHVARVDLRSYSTQRGNETGAEPPPLQIDAKATTFTITLPDGSPRGTYSVTILDAFGKSIRTRTSHSADGKRLTATLNLDNLRNQSYRLCVSRSDEAPNCYPIVIANRGK